jgi:hypothetical protein
MHIVRGGGGRVRLVTVCVVTSPKVDGEKKGNICEIRMSMVAPWLCNRSWNMNMADVIRNARRQQFSGTVYM